MKKQVLGLLAVVFSSGLFAQTVLLECGQNSGRNFNGWFLDSHQLFDDITFDAHSVQFEHWLGGNFTVSLTTEVDALNEYDFIRLLFNFEVVNDCEIQDVVYYVSADGKKWNAINDSRNNVAIGIENSDHTIRFVRVVANVDFEEDGRVELNYAKIEGEMHPTLSASERLSKLPEVEHIPSFYLFNYQNALNIETESEIPYELLITSVSGKIVYRSSMNGSKRVQLPADLKGIYVVSVIQENAFKASKKIII